MLRGLKDPSISFHKIPAWEKPSLQPNAVEHWNRICIGEAAIHHRHPDACATMASQVQHGYAKQFVLLTRIAPKWDIIAQNSRC